MFDVSGDQIAALGDDDLRELTRRLCAAEAAAAGKPESGITAGGHQDAGDGGIDVHVALPSAEGLDFIPTALAAMQCKATAMAPSAIGKEMRPKGVLRSSIRDVLMAGGSYVIVASKGSVTHVRLQERLQAMRAAVAGIEGAESRVHYYGCDHLANWLAKHPGVTLWLRARLNIPLYGWKPYGTWAIGDVEGSEYVVGDDARVSARSSRTSDPMDVDTAIARMRDRLRAPGHVLRLVGLSGTGKTRLAQALFDKRVGQDALEPSQAVYVDLGELHEPLPSVVIARMEADRRRIILVIDNCSPQAHRTLADTVQHSTYISLLSIEYDVSDDEPEETVVFELQSADFAVLDRVLSVLAPHVGHTDRARIHAFSGGNARIALALARTVRTGESLGTLNDPLLLERLFWQRNMKDPALMRAAEVCALVYSFNGEHEASDGELATLSGLAGQTVADLFRHVAELRRRDLVQRRAQWRAVLPHALANRLAKSALESVPRQALLQAMHTERLLKSFSRRLSYLNDSDPAREIARHWLRPGELLGDFSRLNNLGVLLVTNIAPLAQDETLALLTRTVDAHGRALSNQKQWIVLLHHLAYEPERFEASVMAIARLENPDQPSGNSDTNFAELFHITHSGTKAPIEMRLRVVKELLGSDEPALQDSGFKALAALLETRDFRLHVNPEFGALPRTTGWSPADVTEQLHWYSQVLNFVETLRGQPGQFERILPRVANNLSPMWRMPGLPERIESFVHTTVTTGGWADGWFAVRRRQRRLAETQGTDTRLNALEEFLRPRDLAQRVDAYVLRRTNSVLEPVDAESDAHADPASAWQRALLRAEALGEEVVNDENSLAILLPRLFNAEPGLHYSFGKGLGKACVSPLGTWTQLTQSYLHRPIASRDTQVLGGFLESVALRDRPFAMEALDAALDSEKMQHAYPGLQASVGLISTDMARVLKAVRAGVARPREFQRLGWGGTANALSDEDFATLAVAVQQMDGGTHTAVDMIALRLHNRTDPPGPHLTKAALHVLSQLDFSDPSDHELYQVRVLVDTFVRGDEGESTARALCKQLAAASRYGSAWRWTDVIGKILKWYPYIVLDSFFEAGIRITTRSEPGNPLNGVDPTVLLTWAQMKPETRFSQLAEQISVIQKSAEGVLTFSSQAHALMDQCPNKAEVLDGFQSAMHPWSWTGSEAAAIQPYLAFAESLALSTDAQLSAWAREQKSALKERVQRSMLRERQDAGSFE